MKLSGTRTVAATPDALWRILADPERLGAALADVDDVTKVDESRCRVVVRTTTGLGVTMFDVDLAVTDRSEPERARIEAHGRSGGQRVDAVVDVGLQGANGQTEVGWEADVRFAGAISSIGQHALAGLVTQHIDDAVVAAEKLAG